MKWGLGFISGGPVGQVVPLTDETALVGRDPRAQVALSADEQGVSARHAEIRTQGDQPQIIDLYSRGGTFVDGGRVAPGQAWPLLPGSLVRFGEGGPLALFDLVAALDHRAPLVLAREDGEGSWPIEGPLIVGRGAECQVQLDPRRDVLASTKHLHLMPVFGRALVTDLGSANGTFADGRRVIQRVVQPGARIHLGGEEGPSFRVVPRVDGHQAPTRAVAVGASRPREDGAGRPRSGPEPREADGPPAPELVRLDIEVGDRQGRLLILMKTEVHFGRFASMCDLVLRCFPRELESEQDALDRSDAIGPHHGTFVLTRDGVDLIDAASESTTLDGRRLEPGERATLPEEFELDLAGGTLSLRGRLFRHPRLTPVEPALGTEGKHPVECLVLERMGDGADHLYLLLVRQASLGASDDATVRLPLPGVAALHASLFLRRGVLYVSQLGQHPVAVDGTPLSQGTTVPLRLGSRFYMGAVRCTVREGDPADFHPL